VQITSRSNPMVRILFRNADIENPLATEPV
jgi:hypothetical protein